MNDLAVFRENIIGLDQTFESPFGLQKIVYADWTASGRAYQPIEEYLQTEILPFVANTHTGSTYTGTKISQAYEEAKTIIKRHVNAGKGDVLLFGGSGMTSAVNKLQRLLGLRVPEQLKPFLNFPEELRPVVFVTSMEHHSNQTSWLETVAIVEIIGQKNGNVDLEHFEQLVHQYRDRSKIAAVTACSNVTGIETPYRKIAKLIHQHQGLCFVDFACSAPYVDMDMRELDAIYFSPHKFLGGPGTPGVLLFNKKLYSNQVPDHPGGGTVNYSNPWGKHNYIADIEQREDGGTPPYLQAIKAAKCIQLKEKIGTARIHQRERELLEQLLSGLEKIENVKILEDQMLRRLCIVSFMIPGAHDNLVVRLLNDRFGIQARGGCSCAGTYGHYLLDVNEARSRRILTDILAGNLAAKPGWVRLSLHPTTSDAEVGLIIDSVHQVALHHQTWATDYLYDPLTNEYNYGK